MNRTNVLVLHNFEISRSHGGMSHFERTFTIEKERKGHYVLFRHDDWTVNSSYLSIYAEKEVR
jgi:hypothetical protein